VDFPFSARSITSLSAAVLFFEAQEVFTVFGEHDGALPGYNPRHHVDLPTQARQPGCTGAA
jgi:hypothetical protein